MIVYLIDDLDVPIDADLAELSFVSHPPTHRTPNLCIITSCG